MEIILASNSPRRKELLGRIFPKFTVMSPDFEEIAPPDIPAREIPEYFAMGKALSIGEKSPDSLVIGSDTIVLLGDKIFGKPNGEDGAFSMLRELNGKTHEVITGTALCYKKKIVGFSETSKVTFKDAPEAGTKKYIALDSPFDKAGSYGIQDEHISLILEKYAGDFDNIVGLPVKRLEAELKKFLEDIK